MAETNIKNISIRELRENPKNPRTISREKLEKLIDSILEFPKMLHLRPVVGDNGMILGGNQRLQALRGIAAMSDTEIRERLDRLAAIRDMARDDAAALVSLWTSWRVSPTVPYIESGDLSDEQKRQFVIKDNASFGDWETGMLLEEYTAEELESWGAEGWKEPEDVSTEERAATEDDFDEEIDKIEVICRRGDIWQLGNHRLMCGDSVSLEDVEKLMGGGGELTSF